jgi:hypothetical protein
MINCTATAITAIERTGIGRPRQLAATSTRTMNGNTQAM